MKVTYWIFVLLGLLASSASFGSVKVGYDLCTKEGDRYRLDINGQQVQIVKNGALIVDEVYTDLHVAESQELAEIQHGFKIYLEVKDVQSAIVSSVTASGQTRHLLLGETPNHGAVMVFGVGAEVGFTKWCR